MDLDTQLPSNLKIINLPRVFDMEIDPNSLPNNLQGFNYPPSNRMCVNDQTFKCNAKYGQKIELNTLADEITTITFCYHFNQIIDEEKLPPNLKYINFNWIDICKYNFNSDYIEMVNSIPGYYEYDVKIFVSKNIFGINGPKCSIHVVDYNEEDWSSEIYEVVDNYLDQCHGNITIINNIETYEPYSRAKSARK